MPVNMTKDPKLAHAMRVARELGDNWGFPDLKDDTGHKVPFDAQVELRTPQIDNFYGPYIGPTAPLIWGWDFPNRKG